MTKRPELVITPVDKLWKNGEKEALAVRLTHLLRLPDLLSHLDDRNLLPKVAQHAARESESRVGLYKAYNDHKERNIGTFVLTTTYGETKGLATVEPASRLREHKSGLPLPAISSRLVKDLYIPGPKVTAWLEPRSKAGTDKYLTDAYKSLADPNGIASDFFQKYTETREIQDEDLKVSAYTVESLASPDWVQASIRAAGYVEVDRRYYDDSHSRFSMPTMSRYSIAPQA